MAPAAELTPIDNDEPRIVADTGLDARVANIVEPVVNGAGYRLVRVRMSGQNGLTLQIMAERADGTMTVEDCEAVSRMLSPLLDVEDVIDRAYRLEVSSPGIDRPLVRKSDFGKWRGHVAKVETSQMVDGRKRFRGTIIEADDNRFILQRDVPAMGEQTVAEIPFTRVADARLILTDDLIQASLKAAKNAGKLPAYEDEMTHEDPAGKADR